jgi:hypothetical protein
MSMEMAKLPNLLLPHYSEFTMHNHSVVPENEEPDHGIFLSTSECHFKFHN